MEIDDVPVDDIPAAMAFARNAIAEGWWDGDWAESLLNRQTSPEKLMAALTDIGSQHDSAMILAELLKHAAVMAEQIVADDAPHMAEVERLIRQASGLMDATEATMSGAREEHEGRAIDSQGSMSAAAPAVAPAQGQGRTALASVMARRNRSPG